MYRSVELWRKRDDVAKREALRKWRRYELARDEQRVMVHGDDPR